MSQERLGESLGLTFQQVQKESSLFLREEISVSCIGKSLEILRELFSKC